MCWVDFSNAPVHRIQDPGLLKLQNLGVWKPEGAPALGQGWAGHCWEQMALSLVLCPKGDDATVPQCPFVVWLFVI